MRRQAMTRLVFVIPFILLASAASAQQQGHDACARDVSRFCRAVMNDGDSAVLVCLKQHRTRLSKACDKVLTEHGQ
jgi:DNA-binding ferritin-like protein (Dps family)